VGLDTHHPVKRRAGGVILGIPPLQISTGPVLHAKTRAGKSLMTLSSKNPDPIPQNSNVLATWKGIAAYFGCNVRTVRRYEQERGLPVHRAPGKKGGTVFAYTVELDAWLDSRDKEPTQELSQQIGGAVTGTDSSLDRAPSADAKQVSGPSADEPQAQPTSYLRWRPWVFAAATVLICCTLLFWKFGDNRTSAATTSAKLELLNGRAHVPAPGVEKLFLRGRYFWNLRTADGLAQAIDSYTQAIVMDPSYAEAYAGLAQAYDLLPQFGQADLGDSLKKAEQAADRAIELNPSLAAAHTAKAFALFYWDWDIAGSDAEFRKALALDPNSAQTHQWYASALHARLKGDECLQQIDQAVRLDPTSAAIAVDAAYFHADFGNLDSGAKALKELERTQPTLASPALFLGQIYFAIGDYHDYIAQARIYASITRNPDDLALANEVAKGWRSGGRTGLLQGRARALKAAFDRGDEPGFKLGETLVLLGRPNDALAYFKASLDRRCMALIAMQTLPWARPLTNNPGYVALFDRVRQNVHGYYSPFPSATRVSLRLPQ
jgi:Tfp pilus assembly protein PilF